MFFIGLGLSQIIYGPLSDAFGRKKIILLGSIIFFLGTILCIFSKNFNVFLCGRFIQGIGVGAMVCISRAITKDMFKDKLLVKALSYIGMGLAIMPAISPVLGSYIQYYIGWKYEFIFMLLYSLFLQLAVTFFIPETNENKHIKPMKTIIKEYFIILSDHIFLINVIIASFIISMIYIFYSLSSFYFQKYYYWSEIEYSQVAILIAMSLLLGRKVNIYLISLISGNQIIFFGSIVALASSISTFILFYIGFNTILIVLISICLYSISGGIIFSNTFVGATNRYTKTAGLASAMYGVMQMTIVFFLITTSSMLDSLNNVTTIFVFLILFSLLSTIMSSFLIKKKM